MDETEIAEIGNKVIDARFHMGEAANFLRRVLDYTATEGEALMESCEDSEEFRELRNMMAKDTLRWMEKASEIIHTKIVILKRLTTVDGKGF